MIEATFTRSRVFPKTDISKEFVDVQKHENPVKSCCEHENHIGGSETRRKAKTANQNPGKKTLRMQLWNDSCSFSDNGMTVLCLELLIIVAFRVTKQVKCMIIFTGNPQTVNTGCSL